MKPRARLDAGLVQVFAPVRSALNRKLYLLHSVTLTTVAFARRRITRPFRRKLRRRPPTDQEGRTVQTT